MRSRVEEAVSRALKRFPDMESAERRIILTDVTEEVMLAIPAGDQTISELEATIEAKDQELVELQVKFDEVWEEKEALAHEVEILREGEPPPGSHLRLVD